MSSIVFGNFINKLISIFILILLTRYLEVADFGKFSFVLFYITFFGIFTDLGLNMILVREYTRHPENASRLFGNGIVVKLVYTLLTALAACLIILPLGYPADVRLLVYISAVMLFISFRGIFFRLVFEVPFQAHLKMQYPSMINVLNELFTLGIIVAVIGLQGTLTHLVLAMTLANLPGFLAVVYFSTKLTRPVFEIDGVLIRKMVKEAFPVGISGLLESLFILFPVLILSKLADDTAVGHYSLAFRLAASLWIIPTAFMMSLYPFLSQYAQGSPEGLRKACLSGLKVMAIMAIPIAIVVIELATPGIIWISGIAYEPAAAALKLLIIATALYFLNTVFGYTLNAANLQAQNLQAWGMVMISMMFFTIVLVPHFNFMGAAAAAGISLLTGLIFYSYVAERMLGISPWKLFFKGSLAGIMMGLTVKMIGQDHLMTGLILAMVVYVFAVVGLNILNKEDYTLIRKLYARTTG